MPDPVRPGARSPARPRRRPVRRRRVRLRHRADGAAAPRPARARRARPSRSSGETGAGKSTVAKLLARFYDVRAGAVRLDGVDLRDVDPTDLRRAVVMVTQEAYLFSGSSAPTSRSAGPGRPRAEIEAAARAVGVHDLIAVDARRVRHRGRQARRAALRGPAPARLVRAGVPGRPALLDPRRGDQLARRPGRGAGAARPADAARRTGPSVVIAHRLSTVMGVDRVLVVDGGRIVEDGSPRRARGGRRPVRRAARRLAALAARHAG